LKYIATSEYWECFDKLPVTIQQLARKNYDLLKEHPGHTSLYLKKIKEYRSVRVRLNYRALGIESGSDVVWFWIGNHANYEKIIN
jgi:hypothetical protein